MNKSPQFVSAFRHLAALATDEDVDVRFSALLALDACRAAAGGKP